jgi:hypothetical protein
VFQVVVPVRSEDQVDFVERRDVTIVRVVTVSATKSVDSALAEGLSTVLPIIAISQASSHALP